MNDGALRKICVEFHSALFLLGVSDGEAEVAKAKARTAESFGT
jgi:hypothetical protein